MLDLQFFFDFILLFLGVLMELTSYLQDGHLVAPIFLCYSKPVGDCECMHYSVHL